ncbi:MAG: hypothetical protein MUC96_34795 [Myxococcaceae bacterium]|nr:hypothetical protein [Myxococcaceae bacterium]
MNGLNRVVVWCAAVLVTGCGAMSMPDAGSAGGGGAAGGAAGASGGGMAGGAAGGSAGGAAGGSAGGQASTTLRSGTITLTQSSFMVAGMTISSGSISGSFTSVSGPAGASPCVESTVSNCTTTVCDFAMGGGADAGTTSTLDSAGMLSVAGTRVDGGVTLAPGAMGTYSRTFMSQLWGGGETLTVAATGAAVPAFSQTVAAPTDLNVTAPDCPLSSCPAINKTMPLVVSWTGGGTSTVVVNVSVNDTAANRLGTFFCTFPASAGTGMIPASVLGVVPAGTGVITIQPTNTTRFMAGSYQVTLTASGSGVLGSVVVQ